MKKYSIIIDIKNFKNYKILSILIQCELVKITHKVNSQPVSKKKTTKKIKL